MTQGKPVEHNTSAPKGLGLIIEVDPQGPAGRAGVKAGDLLRAINGRAVQDVVDYFFESAVANPRLSLLRDGRPLVIRVQKEAEDSLELGFAEELWDGIRRCRNRCHFCFVDQMPPKLRPTLYLKDDDYRLSLLHGTFITLGNLTPADWARIKRQHLGPLRVSVHTTNPELRRRLMGNPRAGEVLSDLKRLAALGISLHTQVVLLPGINDGAELERTLADLVALYPAVESVAVVPVGLTRRRLEGQVRAPRPRGAAPLPPLRLVDKHLARTTLDLIDGLRRRLSAAGADSLVYGADELFLLASRPIPPWGYYGDFPQLENGVGLVRRLLTGFARRRRYLPPALPEPRRVRLVTGTLAAPLLVTLARELEKTRGLTVEVIPVTNLLFGPSVTVAGLLAGRDVFAALEGLPPVAELLLPSCCLKEGSLFPDEVTTRELARALDTPVRVVPATAAGLVAGVLGKPVGAGF